MFIGRKNELALLDKLYSSDKFEFAVIYGRRRVGKTAIINEFCKGKDAICFTGVETNAKQNLENFSQCIMEYATGIPGSTVFASFQAALEYVFKLAENRRLVLCIDEYPYVARASVSLASTLQLLIDKYKDSSNLFLILCGSSMSYMEDKVLAYKAPLYGRRTAQLKILPFEFWEVREYLAAYSGEDQALAYGIVGGTPQYLMQINDKLSIQENIKALYLDPSSSIYEEPVNLLKQEVREPALYNAIITAVASGASKLSEISGKVGEDTGTCSTYIRSLVALGILKKETPYGENSPRKTIYSVEDNMFRFWYRFVPENTSVIARGAQELAYNRIEPFLSEYMGKIFEDICRQYLWAQLIKGKCAMEFTDLGRWWGTDPRTKSQVEIDIVGTMGKSSILLGECKWLNSKVDTGTLQTLIHRGELFNHPNKQFYLFSKSGFTPGCRELAEKMENVTLLSFQQMLTDWNERS